MNVKWDCFKLMILLSLCVIARGLVIFLVDDTCVGTLVLELSTLEIAFCIEF